MSRSRALSHLLNSETMEGSAKIISLIARDESQHLVLTQNIIKKWQQGDDPEMMEIAEEEKENTLAMFKKCVEEEKEWKSIFQRWIHPWSQR